MFKKIATKLKNTAETHKDEIIGCVLISVSMIIAYKNGRDDGGTQVLKWMINEYPEESKVIVNDILAKRNSRK
ncbi:hypothetical protein CL2_14730 [Anaerostipes hadrus]|jgi:hypothetical protein|uniref:Uncharacterized protein n=1 Tax=Anaerostipes hadrus TaxID=649756 RepID=D4N0M4_ANAHA|nr:hypothetical protein [Anaerostipes hadrus]EDS21597.1 hypothetical protein CLOSS21_01561 [Clostridium sp. SS2/1]CBL38419.1 hypothetical protein CL2_14730 [Anaerostipes hadrus]